jgi:hypothetical protein
MRTTSGCTQIMEAVCPSETSVYFYTTRCYIAENCHLHTRRHVKLFRCRHAGAKVEREYILFIFFISALDVRWPVRVTPRPRFTPGKMISSTHWIGGSVGLRAVCTQEAKGKILCLCRVSNPGRPVCSQTLHWLSYPQHSLPWELQISQKWDRLNMGGCTQNIYWQTWR